MDLPQTLPAQQEPPPPGGSSTTQPRRRRGNPEREEEGEREERREKGGADRPRTTGQDRHKRTDTNGQKPITSRSDRHDKRNHWGLGNGGGGKAWQLKSVKSMICVWSICQGGQLVNGLLRPRSCTMLRWKKHTAMLQ